MITDVLVTALLALLAIGCWVVFWSMILRPCEHRLQHEYVIADFRREISRYEHEQNG